MTQDTTSGQAATMTKGEAYRLIARALTIYGDHTPTCQSWLWGLVIGPTPPFGGCNCGYAALTLMEPKPKHGWKSETKPTEEA